MPDDAEKERLRQKCSLERFLDGKRYTDAMQTTREDFRVKPRRTQGSE